jgi:hypothetical protein
LDDLHGALDAFAVGEGHVEDFDAVAGCDVRWASPSPGTPSADSTVRPTSIALGVAIGLRRLRSACDVSQKFLGRAPPVTPRFPGLAESDGVSGANPTSLAGQGMWQ